MPLMLAAALMLAQVPAAVPPPQSAKPIDVTGKKKPKEKCELMEVTGSHTRQRVCRDEFGDMDLGPNVANSVAPSVLKAQRVGQPGGFPGPSPQ